MSIQLSGTESAPQRETSKGLIGYFLILAVGMLFAFLIQVKTRTDYQAAAENYKKSSQKESEDAAKVLENALKQIYQGIRTISFIPSVKEIDRHGENLSDNAHESIIQIYNNLRSNVTISEVYIVPVDIEPEQIDPVTGSFQTPVLMFDDAVAAHEEEDPNAVEEKITTIEQAEKAPEVEIFEYRALKEQMQYLKEHYADRSTIKDMDLPLLGSPSVLTCDNGDFEKTGKDPDRAGVMLSVPFFGNDGKLRGTVTAVLRDNVIRDMLPKKDFMLVNTEYGYLINPVENGQEDLSKDWAIQKKPDPGLIFSTVVPVKTTDPRSSWVLWAGHPDSRFYTSSEATAIKYFSYFGYGFSVVFVLVGCGIFASIRNNFKMALQNKIDLERKIAERTSEVERLAKEQEQQKAEAEKQRKESLAKMANSFEASVKDVVSEVIAASGRMQSSSEHVAKIADDTKSRSDSVARSTETAAQTSSQVSAAAEELTASIAQISTQTKKSTDIAENAAAQAMQAKEAIETLSSQSSRVGEIVAVISGISDQINLLALNATIESARAGEAGKGFAVVANEVKQLAQQVNGAAEQITQQIDEMQTATKTSVDSVMTIINTIDDVQKNIQSVATAVEEQAAVTNEIAKNISITAKGAQDISANIGAVQKGAEETGMAATDVLESAEILGNQSNTLKGKVEEFLSTVRAA